MAKEIDDDLDLDFGDDDDLDMDFDFGEPESSPPKNTREAIMNTGKQAFKGFKEDLLDDKTQTLIDMARATVPDNLKTETDAIMETSTKIKDALLESADEVRKSGKSFVKALDKVVPQNTIFSRLTKYLDEKLGEDEAKGPSGPSEEQKRHDEALAMISATLGENFEKSRADQLVQQTLEQKRHASTTDLLSNIYAESKQIRSFHVEVSNNYFRKSLELQYKHLYVAKEQLELTKTAFDSFKNQFETIVHNTGLPDLVKLRTSEMIKNSIVKFISQYYIELDGDVDGIVCTAGAGENDIDLRREVVKKLKPLGIILDEEANDNIAKFRTQKSGLITTPESKVPAYVEPTDEESVILMDTYTIAKNN